jgi:hypothetical protein
LAIVRGDDRDSDVPVISNIVIGIVIAWFIIRALDRLAEFRGRFADDKNERPVE